VEKNKNYSTPTYAKPAKKVPHKIVQKKEKKQASISIMCGTHFHNLHNQSYVIHLVSSSGFYHGITLKTSLKEMNEFYNVFKDDLDKENTNIRLHRGAKLEKSGNTTLNGFSITVD
jgi:hypothetical protein